MTFFGLYRIEPPSPNDPTVNVVNQLNNNWNEVERALASVQTDSNLLNIEVGLEVIDDVNKRFQVWDGNEWVVSDNIASSWSAWTAMAAAAPISATPNFTPRWRYNSLLRKVEVGGRMQHVAGDWANVFYSLISDVGGIPAAYQPWGDKAAWIGAATNPIAPSIVSGCFVNAEKNVTSGGNTVMNGGYFGTSSGASSIILDGISWWY